nr:hypothetical protein [Mucilaginibacter sp. 44-25]
MRAAKEGLDNYEWWTNADKLKQKCFYVDYTEDGLADPQQVNEKDWDDAYRFVSKFAVDLNEMMIKIGNAPSNKLKEYIADFENAELVDLFSESINR